MLPGQDAVRVADFDAIGLRRHAAVDVRRRLRCSDSAFGVSSSGVVPCMRLASAAAISMAGMLPSASICSSSGWNSLPAPDSTAAVIFSLNLTTRSSFTSATLGILISSMRCWVTRSMTRSMFRSRGLTNRMASPVRPARPVRPMRWT